MLFRMKVDSEIHLVFLEESLADDLFSLVDSDREYLSKWLPWPPATRTVEDTREFIKASIMGFAEGRIMACAIQYRKTIVGVVGYNKISRSLRKVEVGYWLSSKYQGNGIVTRACGTMIRYAFEDLGMEKVEMSVAVENMASRKVCERLGLTLEGVITNSENLHGVTVSHAIYGLNVSEA